MKNKSLVSITDYSKDDYLKIMEVASQFESKSYQNLLNGKVISTLFLSLLHVPG